MEGYLLCRGFSYGDARRQARYWLEELDLWSVRDRVIARLSGGQAKRVAVAMALASNADVVFLDEPTSGLDVEGKVRVWRSLRKMVSTGAAILLTTHDMREAEVVSDKIIMMSRGIVVAEGGCEDLVSRVPYRYKVMVRGAESLDGAEEYRVVSLGDRVIVYFKSRREALEFASRVEHENVVVGEVSLEDAYMYIVSRGVGVSLEC